MEDEPLGIDDRSGGDRMLASARVGVNRVGELVDEQRLDFVALLWMLSIVAYTGVQIYMVVDLFGVAFADTWAKIAALGDTAGPLIAVSCLAGIALALMSDTAVSRFAIVLAGVVGAWVFVAGMFNVAAAVQRDTDDPLQVGFGEGNRAVGVLGGLALAGFGLVVGMLAWRAGGERRQQSS